MGKIKRAVLNFVDMLMMKTHLGIVERFVPYPYRAARISIDFIIFPWWKPSFEYRKDLDEWARREGETIWWFRWLWVQISYKRWA